MKNADMSLAQAARVVALTAEGRFVDPSPCETFNAAVDLLLRHASLDYAGTKALVENTRVNVLAQGRVAMHENIGSL